MRQYRNNVFSETKPDRFNPFNPQVLALARSDALRGRRRFFSSALPQTSPATPKTAVTTETAAPKRRSAERKLGDGRANPRRHESSGEKLVFSFCTLLKPHMHT